MARLRTNGSSDVLRRRRKISINPESKKDGEKNSEFIFSDFSNDISELLEPGGSKSKKDGEEFGLSPPIFSRETSFNFGGTGTVSGIRIRPTQRQQVSYTASNAPRRVRLQIKFQKSQSSPSSLQSSTITSVLLEQNDVEAVVTDRTSNDLQESSDSYHLEWSEWIFIITNLVLEILLVGLDQMACPQKPEYALTALAVSTIAISVSLFELYLKARRQGLVGFKREGLKFRFHFSSSIQKQFCNFIDVFGLICAFCQFIFSGVAYSYHRRHADNPVNIPIVSLMFIICLAFSKLTKNSKQTSISAN